MMRRRDLCWRAAGMVLIVTACAVAVLAYGSASALFALPAALAGLTLAVQGKRVMQAIRATVTGMPIPPLPSISAGGGRVDPVIGL